MISSATQTFDSSALFQRLVVPPCPGTCGFPLHWALDHFWSAEVATVECEQRPQHIFVPALILSGYWMYAGAVFAIIGVAAWLGAFRLLWIWSLLSLSQIVLFIGRRIYG